jgi:hypothetical protein
MTSRARSFRRRHGGTRRLALGVLALLPWVCVGCTEINHLAIETVPTGIPTLGPARAESVTVVVHDRRSHPSLIGLNVSDPTNLMVVYATKTPDALARTLEKAAMDAARTLGFREGPDVKIDMAIDAFRIDAYLSSGYAPVNCIGYAVIETTLTSARGASPVSRSSRLAYWELTAGLRKASLGKEAISRIYTQAAWEATTRILQQEYPALPDPAAMAQAIHAATGAGDVFVRREAVFWLGLTGSGNDAVAGALASVFRTATDQEVSEAAAEAIGLVGEGSARSELEAVLAGTRRLENWDNLDTEAVWYLVKALYLLGAPDPEARVPASPHLHQREKIGELLRFLETGTLPSLTPSQEEDLQKTLPSLNSPR